MNLAFLCQAIGISVITAMAALQGSFWIVVPGTLILLAIVRPRVGGGPAGTRTRRRRSGGSPAATWV
ncbi:hypothetical protein ACFQY7_49865 [Actinomadura luteofluorescens]|uniref:hypothetical protein n=1 Tax=Actinomadura luteofluorescens TaxID=46163 RepID=UPI003641B56F